MKLNPIFTSHMVIPAHKPVRIWGVGRGEATVEFAGQKKSFCSEEENWLIEFPPMEYGGPYEMKVTFPDSEILLDDIYVGLVFLFAGQSNMVFKLHESNTPPESYRSNPMLRLFSTARLQDNERFKPEDGWLPCRAEEAGDWSAIAYHAGLAIAEERGVAVGAIACYQGASVIESWVPDGALGEWEVPDEQKFIDHFYPDYVAWRDNGKLYSYALGQVVPYPLTAVAWYQGESDMSEAEGKVYAEELCILIDLWRRDFRDPTLPFVVVQIADNTARQKESIGWSLVQQAQMAVQDMRPCVKTVRSADVCEASDIHPKSKTALAHRVADALKEFLD